MESRKERKAFNLQIILRNYLTMRNFSVNVFYARTFVCVYSKQQIVEPFEAQQNGKFIIFFKVRTFLGGRKGWKRVI